MVLNRPRTAVDPASTLAQLIQDYLDDPTARHGRGWKKPPGLVARPTTQERRSLHSKTEHGTTVLVWSKPRELGPKR